MRLNWLLCLLNDKVGTGNVFVFLDACRENVADRTWRLRGWGGKDTGAGDEGGSTGLSGSFSTGSTPRKLYVSHVVRCSTAPLHHMRALERIHLASAVNV